MCQHRFKRSTKLCVIVLLILLSAFTPFNPTVKAAPSTCTGPDCNQVDVSPGMFAGNLGLDFPSFAAVKLSYPNGSILTNSIGDLLFSVTLRPRPTNRTIDGITNASSYNSVDIYIPPDFIGLTIEQVWTSYTNNYDPNSMSLSKLGSTDQIAPNWWRISVKNIFTTANQTLIDTNSTLTSIRVFPANRTQYLRIFQLTSPSIAGRYFFKAFINGTSIGASNFPTVVVRGSNDPAYISGTLRDAGNTDPSLYGLPINVTKGFGGRVVAAGTDYLGRPAAAQAFINSTANGQYTLFGLAPGTYNLTAYAAGFRPTTLASRISVHRTQSLEGIDIYLPHSISVTGTVLSLCSDNTPIPWGQVFRTNGVPTNRSISVKVLALDGSQVASIPPPFGFNLVTNYTNTTFRFSIYREVGWDGRIPQDFASYTSGLSSGDYLLRAFVTQYVQFDEVRIHVTNDTLRTFSEIPLIRSGFFIVTVHFKDYNSTPTGIPLATPGTLSVSVYDQSWTLRGQNTTFVPAGATFATIEILGFSGSRGFGIAGLFSADYGLPPGTYHIIAKLQSSPTFAGFANVGIRQLYYQLDDVQGTIGFPISGACIGPSILSFSIYRGGGIRFTMYSVDTENPYVLQPWFYPSSNINLKIVDSHGIIYSANATQPFGIANETVFYSGLLTNDYVILVNTVGYVQSEIVRVHVVMGSNSDISIRMVIQPTIKITLLFKAERIFTFINSTLPYAQPINNIDETPIRIEIYNSRGEFVGANATYIPNENRTGGPTTEAVFRLAGFDRYFGDPKFTWSGFYDTTDAARQLEGGLPPGEYTIVLWVDGYYQTYPIRVTLFPRAESSLIVSVECASRISGRVVGTDYLNEAVYLSWAVLDLEPGNYTTYSLDGRYQLWVPGGDYGIGVSLPGYVTVTGNVSVPWGSDLKLDFWLDYAPGGLEAFAILQISEPTTFSQPSVPTRFPLA